MSWRSLYSSREKYFLFFFIYTLYPIVRMYHNLLNQPPDGGHLDCFQALSYIFKNLFLHLVGKVKEYSCIMWPKEMIQAPDHP